MSRDPRERDPDRPTVRSAGYLWRPGRSPQDDPLHLTVALVIAAVIVGSVLLALLT